MKASSKAKDEDTGRGLHYLGLVEAAQRLKRGAVRSVDLTAAVLDRIAAFDDVLGSYTTVLRERALERAEVADRELANGLWRGPLHGVPIAVKDLCYTAWAPTAAGMPINRDFVPAYDATVVERLERAGAIIVGKLTMTEAAFSWHHPEMPRAVNPWQPEVWPGVSSSGSGSATAAGLCFGSLGSDTGGSIRFPSTACGLTGLKPTWGRVSRHGIFPLAASLDHIGPMARSAEDAAALLSVIAGADRADPTALNAPVPNYLAHLDDGVRGLRLGIAHDYAFTGLDGEVAGMLGAAVDVLVDLGMRKVPVAVPWKLDVAAAWSSICVTEARISHESTYPSRASEYGREFTAILESLAEVDTLDLGKAMQRRLSFSGQLADVFAAVDVLIVPAIPTRSPTLAEWTAMTEGPLDNIADFIRFASTFNLTGSPTLTLPGGFDSRNVPMGFQLVGPHLSEEVLLRVGYAFQRVTGWHTRHPRLENLAAATAAAA